MSVAALPVSSPQQGIEDEHAPDPAAALAALLEQLRDVLTLLPPGVYRATPAARVSGSVGEHVRHTLDHVTALLACCEGSPLSYDRRMRGALTETDPVTAVNEIERMLYRLGRLTAAMLDRPVRFPVLVEASSAPVTVHSTLARELTFVIQHTIHHCAIIAVLLNCQGWSVPRGFGLAPSTAQARHQPSR